MEACTNVLMVAIATVYKMASMQTTTIVFSTSNEIFPAVNLHKMV